MLTAPGGAGLPPFMLQALAASGLVPAMAGVGPGLAGMPLPQGLSAAAGFAPGVPPGAAAAALAAASGMPPASGSALDWHAMTTLGGIVPGGQQQPQVVLQGGHPF